MIGLGNSKIFMKIAIMTIVVILIFGMSALAAFADESDRMPDLEGDRGNLTISVIYHDDDKAIPVRGVHLEATRVASMEVDGGAVTYSLMEPYDGHKIKLEGMTAEESNKIAKILDKEAESIKTRHSVKVTNSSGQVYFSDLELGMYLIRQVYSSSEAKEYETLEPFLVMIPMIGEGNQWIYNVDIEPKPLLTALPKVSKTEPPSKPNQNTRTEDKFNLLLVTVGLIASAIIIIVILARRRVTLKS